MSELVMEDGRSRWKLVWNSPRAWRSGLQEWSTLSKRRFWRWPESLCWRR